ncbi:MAG: hypothetical protein N2449_07255 [Bacteroidales bacterium]|nr:hypothetical protein [Bacteroidales bacterium]
MKFFFEKYPWHSFLILPYLAIFLFAKNAHLLTIDVLIRPLLISFIVSSSGLFVAYYLFQKKIQKAGIWISFVLFLLANYGFIYDFLELAYYKGLWPFSNIHRYLILIFILIILVAYLFIRFSKYYFINLTRWLNILLPLLIVANIIFILINPYASKNNNNYSDCVDVQPINFSNYKPDVYYFILDGFANKTTLEKYYHTKIDTFYSFLNTNNFYIAHESFANYFFTANSLSATLNMNYLENFPKQSLSNNLVFRVFKALGYKIYTINSGYAVSRYFVCSDVDFNKEMINDYERAILKNTIFRLDDLIGIIPYFRVKQQLDFIRQIDFQNNSPKFVFAHIVCPHPPYVFSKEGKLKPVNSFSDKTWDPKEAYAEQLQYIAHEIMGVIQTILSNYNHNNKPLIILQSDHGPFLSNPNPDVVEYSRTHVLNALMLKNNDSLYQNISLVNTFRYVFRHEFKLNIKLLPDSMLGLHELLQNRNFTDLQPNK